MIVDMHAHWVPRGLIRAAEKGVPWYGWRILQGPNDVEYLALDQRLWPYRAAGSSLLDPDERRRQRIAEQGIDFEGLMLLGLFWNYHLPPDEGSAFCREVNTELAEVERAYPLSYRALGVLPMQSTRAALAELEHAVTNLGLGSFVIAASIEGKNLDDLSVLPVLEAAAEAGVSVSVHPPIWDKAADARLPRYFFANSFGAPLESSIGVMSVIYSGLLDRYPDLRLSFTHGGGWVQYGVGRFTLRYHQRDDAHPMALPPAEYLPRMWYDCLIHDEESFKLLVKRVGSTQLFVGTDWPALGDIPGGAANWIKSFDWLSEDERQDILWRNASRFLGIADRLADVAEPKPKP